MSARVFLWLAFAISGVVAFGMLHAESLSPALRVAAGWYAIFVIAVIALAALVTLSVWWGPLKNHPFFDLW
jgi:hypothetical protein